MPDDLSNPKPIKRRGRQTRSRVKARRAAMALAMGAKSQAEAMRIAGYSESAIKARNGGELAKMREEFQGALAKALPDDLFVAKVLEGLEATKPVVVMDGPGSSHVEHYPDPHARVKYLQLSAQILGVIVRHVEQKHDIGPQVADIIAAARRRVTGSQAIPERPALPDVTPDVTVEPTDPDKSAS